MTTKFNLSKITGWFLFTVLITSVLHGFGFRVPVIFFGTLSLLSITFLFSNLVSLQKKQISILLLFGLTLIAVSSGDILPKLIKAITVNHEVIALIISVSFLRLVAIKSPDEEKLPKGNQAFLKTLSGVFLFASVINLSAIVVFADRLKKYNSLSNTQIMILMRMFGANAFWSPFFASMGAALIYSSGAEFTVLLKAGLFLGICSIVLTALQGLYFSHFKEEIFDGYPMHLKSLYLPALLSVFVILAHHLLPNVSILIVVSFVVLSTVIFLLMITQPSRMFVDMKKQIETGVSNSISEISLFFSAGVFAVGISSYVLSSNYVLPISEYTGHHAAITLVCMVLISLIGVHPIISISVLGGLLAPLGADPNLLGMLFVFSWGVSVPLSSFSGISLLMQSRYNVAAIEIIKINAGYTSIMLCLACAVLIMYGG